MSSVPYSPRDGSQRKECCQAITGDVTCSSSLWRTISGSGCEISSASTTCCGVATFHMPNRRGRSPRISWDGSLPVSRRKTGARSRPTTRRNCSASGRTDGKLLSFPSSRDAGRGKSFRLIIMSDGFVAVAKAAELPPGEMRWAAVDGERLVLANVEGTFFALRDVCGHRNAPLSRGKLLGHLIECPLHFAQFDVRTGELVSGPVSTPVPTYQVRVAGDTVYVKR